MIATRPITSATILSSVRTIAMVGASANPVRPSYFVLKYLIDKGYEALSRQSGPGRQGDSRPPGPCQPEGRAGGDRHGRCLPQFRAALAVTGEALALDPLPKVIWMQLSVRNDEAAALAEAQGVAVVMNRCPKMEYGKLSGEWAWVGGNPGLLSSRRPTRHSSGRFQKSRDCAEILTATAARPAARCQSGGPGRSHHRGPASI